jgi:hypothetical protein
MASQAERIPVQRLREAAAAAVLESSRQRVAAEIGLSSRGLWKFLGGARPHPATIEKLERWFHGRGLGGAQEGITVVAALGVLLARVRPAEREEALRETLAFFEEPYSRRGGR